MKNSIRDLLKRPPDTKVIDELGKLLVGHPDLKVPLKELTRSAARLKVELRRKFGKDLERFYRSFLRRCLKDKLLTTEDWKALYKLKILFGFSDSFVERVHNEEVLRHYRKGIDQALADKKLLAEERSMLKFIREKWNLPPELAQQIYRDKASELIERALVQAISDERLSPDEERELRTLADRLGAQIEMDERTKSILDRYRLYWLIENGEIPAIDVSIPLKRQERCYFNANVAWCQTRSVQKASRYKKAVGALEELQRRTVQEMAEIDSGLLYLTNQRILFYGEKHRAISLTQVTDFVAMEEGVHIIRKSGTFPFLKFDLGVDVFALMLARALRDLHQ